MHYEQDGLILRVMESESKRAVWPGAPGLTPLWVPRVPHVKGSSPGIA